MIKPIVYFIISTLFGSIILATPPETAKQVDLNRYLGQWYEVARLPNAFEPADATNIMATYSQGPDNLLKVENQYTRKGEIKKIQGVARIDDPKTNAKLGVSFFNIFGYRPVWGDYWILEIGPDYSYSVVGDRSRKFAWILSRTPELPPQRFESAIRILERNGYDIKSLIFTKH